MAATQMECLCRLAFSARCPRCRTCYTCCNCTWTLGPANVDDFQVIPGPEPTASMACWRRDRLGDRQRCDHDA